MRSGTLERISSLPPRWARNTRSDTLPSSTPSSVRSAAASSSACSAPRVAAVTSIARRSEPEAVTSSAVTIAPTFSISVVSSLTAVGRAGSSSRMVTE